MNAGLEGEGPDDSSPRRDGSLNVLDPFNYDVQLANTSKKTNRVEIRRRPSWKGLSHTKLDEFETRQDQPPQADRDADARRHHGLRGRRTQAQGAGSPSSRSQLINHVSYTCPNFKQAARLVFEGVQPRTRSGRPTRRRAAVRQEGRAALRRHRQGRAADVPSSSARPTARASRRQPRGAAGSREAVIDHIGYTVADFNRDARQGRR